MRVTGLVVAVAMTAGCSTVAGHAAATPTPPTTPPVVAPAPTPASIPAPPAGRPWSVVVTFYAAGDNDPPGSRTIAHPNARHRLAGGTGTFADPLSLASDPRELAVGTRIYYAPLQKYFVMEDDCVQCMSDWRHSRIPHVDLWTGDYAGRALTACEAALTPDGRMSVEVDPPPGRPVDPRPLYAAGTCLR